MSRWPQEIADAAFFDIRFGCGYFYEYINVL